MFKPTVLPLAAIALLVLQSCLALAQDGENTPVAQPDAVDASPNNEHGSYDKRWYLAFGASNYHAKLEDSEAQIDQQINDLLDWIPMWKRPVTFEDWRDDFRLWDLCLGMGRDLTPSTAWMIWTGGATGADRSCGGAATFLP